MLSVRTGLLWYERGLFFSYFWEEPTEVIFFFEKLFTTLSGWLLFVLLFVKTFLFSFRISMGKKFLSEEDGRLVVLDKEGKFEFLGVLTNDLSRIETLFFEIWLFWLFWLLWLLEQIEALRSSSVFPLIQLPLYSSYWRRKSSPYPCLKSFSKYPLYK